MVRDKLKELSKSEALHEKRTKDAAMLHREVELSLFPVKGGMPDVCRVQLKKADSNYFTKIMKGEAFESPDKKKRSELRPVDVLVLEHHAWTRDEMELKRKQLEWLDRFEKRGILQGVPVSRFFLFPLRARFRRGVTGGPGAQGGHRFNGELVLGSWAQCSGFRVWG